MNTQTIYLHHSWKFHYGEAAPDMQPAASDGIVEPFPCLRSIVENASCCCLTVSTKKARSGSTVIITAFIPMDTHLFSMT